MKILLWPLIGETDTLELIVPNAVRYYGAYLEKADHMLAADVQGEARERNLRTVQAFFRLMHQKDIEAWAALWNPDAEIIVPYPPQGFPDVIKGTEQIVPGFRDLFAHFGTYDYTIQKIYPAIDPDVVIVQWEVKATLPAKGSVYRGKNITIFRFRNYKIAAYHDYFDPRKFQTVVDAIAQSQSAGR